MIYTISISKSPRLGCGLFCCVHFLLDVPFVGFKLFLSGQHICEFEAVTHQVTEMPYFRRGNNTGFHHIAHKEVADPFSILAVSLVAFLGFCVLWMGKEEKRACLYSVRLFVSVNPPVKALFAIIGNAILT